MTEDTETEDPSKVLEDEAVARLGNLSEEEIAKRARRALISRLAAKAEAGTLSHQEAGVLRNMLRDGGLVLDFGNTKAIPKPLPVDDDDLPQFED